MLKLKVCIVPVASFHWDVLVKYFVAGRDLNFFEQGFFICSFYFSFAVAGIPLTASILTTGVVCTFYTSLASKCLTTQLINSWHRACNGLFLSSLVPLFQSESTCETILMKMTLICMKMKLHAELIFIWKVSHLDSFWNRYICNSCLFIYSVPNKRNS